MNACSLSQFPPLDFASFYTGAELNIYMLLVSLREMYRRHPLLHTFSRFIGLLEEVEDEGQEEMHREGDHSLQQSDDGNEQ